MRGLVWTDVGVSAAGRVVSLWVRSALPVNRAKLTSEPEPDVSVSDLAGSSTPAELDTVSDAAPDIDQLEVFPDFPSFHLDEPPLNSPGLPPRTEERIMSPSSTPCFHQVYAFSPSPQTSPPGLTANTDTTNNFSLLTTSTAPPSCNTFSVICPN